MKKIFFFSILLLVLLMGPLAYNASSIKETEIPVEVVRSHPGIGLQTARNANSVVEVETIEIPEGIITVEKEVIESQPRANLQEAGDADAIVEVETIEVPEGGITVEKTVIEPEISINAQTDGVEIESKTYFSDDLNATCPSGARFDFSTTGPGGVTYLLNWSSGSHQGDSYCSGSQCGFTITTSWSAFYTDAWAWVYNPLTIWGPNDAYRCR